VPLRRGRAGIARPCAPGGVAAAKPRARRCGRGRRLTIASAGRPAARDQGAAPSRRPGAAATVTGASWRARRLVAVPISCLHRCQQWDGMVGGLGLSQQIEQHGAHDRGDTENRIISGSPAKRQRRICARPGRTGWLLGLQVADRSRIGPCPVVDDRSASDYVRGNGMAGPWRRLLPGHATPPAVVYDLVRRRRWVWAPRS
jgi:hypothetical protein